LSSHDRPIKAWPIITDDCQFVTALKPELFQTATEISDFFFGFGPGPGLPDAQVFFSVGWVITTKTGVFQQPFW